MKLAELIESLRKNLKTLKIAMIICLALLVVFDFALSREHAHYLIDKIWAWWSVFGTVGCFLLIKVSKGIAHLFLAKDENFYD